MSSWLRAQASMSAPPKRAGPLGPRTSTPDMVARVPERRTAPSPLPPDSRIQRVPQGVAQPVEAEYGDADGGPGRDGHPPVAVDQEALTAVDHEAPVGRGRRRGESQEGQGGLCQHGEGG